eukprot:15046003-Alexandrium_andersonii.AAC.1
MSPNGGPPLGTTPPIGGATEEYRSVLSAPERGVLVTLKGVLLHVPSAEYTPRELRGQDVEAVSGPAQFKLRRPQAVSH